MKEEGNNADICDDFNAAAVVAEMVEVPFEELIEVFFNRPPFDPAAVAATGAAVFSFILPLFAQAADSAVLVVLSFEWAALMVFSVETTPANFDFVVTLSTLADSNFDNDEFSTNSVWLLNFLFIDFFCCGCCCCCMIIPSSEK
jgi:hypothetical protein